MKDDYLPLVRWAQENRKFLFPKDKLGVADRFLLNMVARKVGREFRESREDKKILLSYNFIKLVNDEMKEFGYKGRELENL